VNADAIQTRLWLLKYSVESAPLKMTLWSRLLHVDEFVNSVAVACHLGNDSIAVRWVAAEMWGLPRVSHHFLWLTMLLYQPHEPPFLTIFSFSLIAKDAQDRSCQFHSSIHFIGNPQIHVD
jgi:hypothetical protein